MNTDCKLPLWYFLDPQPPEGNLPTGGDDNGSMDTTASVLPDLSKTSGSTCPSATALPVSTLYYGDNLDILRNKKFVPDESVDLCYIDPPFNSKRHYFQIYNNVPENEDRALPQAFVDTWKWNSRSSSGFTEILSNEEHRFHPKTIELMKGLRGVLGEGGLLAYLTSMTLRIVEIHRALKPTGSFYLHCDPTASHYLKLALDSVFCTQGGDFKNEIAWCYASGGVSKRYFAKKHDIIFFYTKSKKDYTFNTQYRPYSEGTKQRGLTAVKKEMNEDYELRPEGAVMSDWWPDITPLLSPTCYEREGYPTQKPETLLERIISASSNEGDVILDAYCGCGTTVAVAQRLKRQWVGIDITYQAISLILRRLERQAGVTKWPGIQKTVKVNGIPRDMNAVRALANKEDDRLHKEFEKWAILTYSNNRAAINEKKGADAGIDGKAYFLIGPKDNASVVFQVKSGNVGRGDIAKLHGDMMREQAEMAVFITLEPPTSKMTEEAAKAGQYHHPVMGRDYDKIQIVTTEDVVMQGKRMDLPLALEVLKTKKATRKDEQVGLFRDEE